MSPEEKRTLTETLGEINTVFSKTLKSALKPIPTDSDLWAYVLIVYADLQELKGFINRTLLRTVNSPEGKDILELLYEIRQAERDIFELHVAMAEKTSGVDVTSQYSVADIDLMMEQDPSLRRVALANTKKYGRKLLQKWHPDKPGGNEEVFQLCKTAIDSGDVELVHILLYRYGDSNYEAPPEFHPDKLASKLRVRLQKFRGSTLFRVFSCEARGQHELFLTMLTNLLQNRLRHLKLAAVPYGTVEPTPEESSDESE